jgi:hypothetical protein
MDMKHRRDRHVHVIRPERRVRRVRERTTRRERVEDELPMAVIDALRQPGRSGRIKRRGAGVFVQRREIEGRRSSREHRLVLRRELDVGLRRGCVVADQHEANARPDLAPDRVEQGKELRIDQNDVVSRMIDGVEDLLRRNPHVHRVQCRAHHRNREKAFEVAMTVPVHHGDHRAALYAKRGERGGET